jgi:hypothetical protein
MEDLKMSIQTNDPILTSWHRYFRRTSVYIAEYILMLAVVGSFVGVASSSIYSFFNLIQTDGYAARALAVVVIAQLASLIVLAPAAYWLFARVSGQESVEPQLRTKTARTVFISIWLIGMMLSIIGVSISVIASMMSGLVGADSSSVGEIIVRVTIPGILVIALLASTVLVVTRRVARKATMYVGIGVASLLAILFVGNLVAAVVKKDAGSDSSESCTYSRYSDGDCSYSDYREYRNGSRSDYSRPSSRSGGLENIYQPSFRN